MKKVVITGHSEGLGKALAAYYLRHGCAVFGLSRRVWSEGLSENLLQYAVDLSDSSALIRLFATDAIASFSAGASEILLINNAGTTAPNALLGMQSPAEIAKGVALNVTAPLLLSNHLAAVKPDDACLKIIHVSSGAGRKAYQGWSVYGAAKAALDHHACCVAAENHPLIRIASVAPGVIDTPMQAEIRACDSEKFPLRQQFETLKQAGILNRPEEVAQKIADMIEKQDFGSIVLRDVRDPR